MDEFKARVTAELDTTEAERKLNQLANGNKKVKIGVDTGNSKNSVDSVNNSMKSAQKTASSFGNTMKKSLNIGSAAAITAKGIHLINTAARDATKAVKDFDGAITDLRMATNDSYESVANLVKGYNQMGKSLGATTTEVTSSADAWLRQGKSIQETNTLIKDSMILSKVGQIDSAAATEYLTSAMKGYNVSVQDTLGIVDKLSAIDLVSATDAGGLAEAMSRTAVTANMAGVSMDKLLGYLAAVGEVSKSKSMTSIGESFKTIFTRMSDIKAGKLELIDEDGTVEVLSDVEQTLRNVGIDLRATVTEYNNYSDVLDNLAAKWDTLNKGQQNALTKAFAGTRQGENFRILMENYDNASKYMETAMNSAGTAEEKFGAYLDSIEAKTKTLQAAFESLAVNTFSTELFGGVIEASTAVLEFLDTTNLLKGSLAGIAAAGTVKAFTSLASGIAKASMQMSNFGNAMVLLKTGKLGTADFQDLILMTENLSKSQLKAVLSSKALTVQQRVAILTNQGMSAAEAKATLTTMGLATAEGTATASTFSLTAAFKGLWATLMANPFILVIAGVTAAVSAYSTYKQHIEEARQASLEAGNAAKDEVQNIRNLYNAYTDAKSAYDSNTGSKESLDSATNALLDSLGVEQATIDALVQKYGNLDEAINQVTADSLKDKLSDLTAGYEAASDTLLDATSNGVFSNFDSIDFKKKNGAYKPDTYADILKNAGFNITDDFSYNGGYTGSSIDIGDNSTVEGAIEMYDNLINMRKALEAEVGSAYTREELSESKLYKGINDKINSFSKEYEDVLDYVNQINETVAQLDYMELAKTNGIPKTQAEFNNLKKSMLDAASSSGEFIGSQEQIEAAITNTLASIPELSQFVGNYGDDVSETASAMAESINTSMEKVQSLVNGIASVQEVLNSQSTGKSLSLDDFNSDELLAYRDAIEYVNGSMQLNADKVNEIAKAKAEEQIAINNTNKALEQARYLDNAKQIEQYRQKLKDANYAEGETAASVQASIDALLTENSAIAASCTQYDLMTASIREATGAYQNWLNSQNASQKGDMFDDTLNAMQHISDTLGDAESEFYGRIGRTDYKSAIDLIVPDSVDGEDQAAVQKYMDSIHDMFTYDDDGNRNGLDIEKFCQKAVDNGLMVLDEATDSYKIAGSKTMEDFAEGLNLSMPLVQAMFGEMEEFGGEFDWADEAVKTIGDLAVEANEAAEALRGMDGNENLAIKMDVSDIETTEGQLEALDATIAEMDGIKAKAGVDASEIENANSVIQYCLTQKQLLSQPDVMRVDTSQVEGAMGEALALLQEFQNAQNNLEIQQKIGADTSEAQAQVDSLTQQIQGISPDIKATLSVDTTSAESISQSIAGLSAETINVKANVDASAISGYNPESKSCDVIYNPKTDALPKSFDSIDRTVNYVANTANLPGGFSTITRYVKYVKTGDVSVNGTAHASGTAKVGGDWGTASGGTTLVGELGQEIVVDPRTGRWYTVGDMGAEFRDIPAGAIVFNHIQSKALLENGYVAGRASALVGGTAMVTGGIKRPYTKKPATHANASNSSSKKPSSSSKKSSSSSSKEEEPQVFDWIEIAIDRIERVIKNLANTAQSTFKKLADRLSATDSEIRAISSEIATQQKAYNRYMQQANSVGLSSDLAQKVRDGAIDINEYDSATADLIQDYEKWYQKALDCSDAVDELHESLASLYKDKFDMATTDFENQLAVLEHLTNTYNNGIADLEARGYMGSAKYYSALKNAENKNLSVLNDELNGLVKAMSQAVNSGEVKEGSEAWYEMQQEINTVKERIQEANIALIEYDKSIRELNWGYFDYLQDRISAVADETQFLVDLMSNSDLYDDRGQLSDTGMATMGLHGVNYNTYMAQADKYAQELLKINEELAKDPYDTELIERKEELLSLQQDSILAAEDEKQAIIDMVEEGINLELDALKDLIDAYTDSLDSAKDLYDYQKKVKDQASEIASLQKQLSAYANDTSEENRALKQKLEVDLSDAMEELQETEYEHYISDQKKLLDELYTEYETILNQRLDNVDALISDMIDAVNSNSAGIADTIKEETDKVGYTMSDSLQQIWSNEGGANSIITKYGENFCTQLTSVNTVLNAISANVASMIAASDKSAQDVVDKEKPTTPTDKNVKPPSTTQPTPKPPTTTAPPPKTIKVGGKINAGSAKIYDYAGDNSGERQYFRNDPIYTVLSEQSGYLKVRHHKLSSGVTGWFKKGDVKAYKTGGLVNYTGLAQLDGTPGKPELVLNAQDTENFIQLKDALRSLMSSDVSLAGAGEMYDMAQSADISHEFPSVSGLDGIKKQLTQITEHNTDYSGNIYEIKEVNIPIGNVYDYNDFMEKMKKDMKFERMIQSMTLGRMMGGSELAKNRFKWKY